MKSDKNRTGRIANCFRLDGEVHRLIEDMAKASGFSKTQLVEMCVIAHSEGIAEAANRVRDEIRGDHERPNTHKKF